MHFISLEKVNSGIVDINLQTRLAYGKERGTVKWGKWKSGMVNRGKTEHLIIE